MSTYLAAFYDSGRSVYIRIFRFSDGKLWNGTTFETWTVGNVTTYGVVLTEDGTSGYYRAVIPTTLPEGRYDYSAYERITATQAITDPFIPGSSVRLVWSGTAVTSATPGTNQRTIGNLTDILQEAARNAGIVGTWASDPYTLAHGHHAIRSSIERFIRETRCTRRTSTATTTDGTATITFA